MTTRFRAFTWNGAIRTRRSGTWRTLYPCINNCRRCQKEKESVNKLTKGITWNWRCDVCLNVYAGLFVGELSPVQWPGRDAAKSAHYSGDVCRLRQCYGGDYFPGHLYRGNEVVSKLTGCLWFPLCPYCLKCAHHCFTRIEVVSVVKVTIPDTRYTAVGCIKQL